MAPTCLRVSACVVHPLGEFYTPRDVKVILFFSSFLFLARQGACHSNASIDTFSLPNEAFSKFISNFWFYSDTPGDYGPHRHA